MVTHKPIEILQNNFERTPTTCSSGQDRCSSHTIQGLRAVVRASINARATLPNENSLMSFRAVTATKIEQTNITLIPLCQWSYRVNKIVIRYTIVLNVKPKHRTLPLVSLVI